MSSRRSGKASGGGKAVQLRRRQKSMADIVNEQMTEELGGRRGGRGAARHDPLHDDDDANFGVAEDYEWGDDAADGDDAAAGQRKRGRGDDAQRLRRRGPLDPSLSEGKYAAEPVGNVDAMMDDIFGTLDMGDMEAEDDEDVPFDYSDDDGDGEGGEGSDFDDDDDDDSDGDAGRGAGRRRKMEGGKSKKVRKAKDLSEEEYMAFLEQKSKRRRAAVSASGLGLGAVGGEEGAILAQLEDLRQAQISLVKGDDGAAAGTEGGEGAAAAGAAASTLRARTQEAVQRYIMLYSQLLRLRVKLQPAVAKAVSMPQYYAKPLFTEEQRDLLAEGADGECGAPAATAAAYDAVTGELTDLLNTLYSLTEGGEAPPPEGATARKGRGRRAPSFALIQAFHQTRVKTQVDSCLEYWGSKLVQVNSAKLKTIAQPLPQQIEAILANMPRLRRKIQKNRASLPILAHPTHERAAVAAAAAAASPVTASASASASAPATYHGEEVAQAAVQRALAIAEGDIDDEIFDDSDFLRELVRRGGAVAHRLEQQLAQINKETMPAKQASRKGFHRLTKGKEVNYDPRPKIVGFLMSTGFEESSRNDIVFKSLFQ